MLHRGRTLLFVKPTRLSRQHRNPNRIVIPRLSPPAGTDKSSGSEYEANKAIPAYTSQFLDREGTDSLRRQEQLKRFSDSTEAQVVQVWRDGKSHLRRQQALIDEMGIEGAVRETLDPSRTSFHQELKSRPLDRAILEEIYLGLHGRRVERRLKKGVAWEHWITKGDGTAPVYTTSRKGQQTFAFGGRIRQVAKATHPLQFPLLTLPGREVGGALSRTKKRVRGGVEVVDRELLVPEVAFIGRTSSGKSSLINAIVNASIAPYGHLQGTTSAVSFYSIADRVVLVDCPGYGYYNPMETPPLDAENAVKAMRAYLKAGARRERRAANNVQRIREEEEVHTSGRMPRGTSAATVAPLTSLHGVDVAEDSEADAHLGKDDDGDDNGKSNRKPVRPALSTQPRNVKRVFLCVPARGLQHTDLAYCRLLEGLGLPFAVVLTKTDAAPIRMLARLADHTRAQLVQFTQCKELMLASSLRLAGIDKMQSLIGSMAVTEDRMDGATMDFSSIV